MIHPTEDILYVNSAKYALWTMKNCFDTCVATITFVISAMQMEFKPITQIMAFWKAISRMLITFVKKAIV